jgi:hypothetical protein
MKKILLSTVLVVMAGAMNISAQSEINFTVKAGLNLSKTTYKDMCHRPGFNVGLGVEWTENHKFALETGLYCSEARGKYGKFHIGGNKTTDYNFRLINLQLPILAKYYFYEGLHAYAGPYVEYKMANKSKPRYLNVISATDNFYCGGMAGLGYLFKSGLLVSADYMFGLKNYDCAYGSKGTPGRHKSVDSKNSTFRFNIGWRF